MPGIYRTIGQGGRGALGVLVVVEVVVDVLLGRAVGLVLGVVAAELDAVLRREGALEAPREGAGHAAPEEREVADRAAQRPPTEVVGAECMFGGNTTIESAREVVLKMSARHADRKARAPDRLACAPGECRVWVLESMGVKYVPWRV